MNYDYAIVLGRFQLPHRAHFQLIQKALEIADTVIIGIGSSNLRRSLRNPFNYEQRISLIEHGSRIVSDAIRSGRIHFMPIEDSIYSDQWWVEHVQRQTKQVIQKTWETYVPRTLTLAKPNIALVGHKKDDTSYYLNMFPQWDYVGVEATQLLSATECREAYYEFGLEDNTFQNKLRDFTTTGVIDALKYIPHPTYTELKNRYEFVKKYREEWGVGPHYTADAVVVKSGHILLITRGQEPDIGSWAFPGGFINKDESSYQACLRECEEETGLKIPDFIYGYKTFATYEKPFRDDRGDIRTVASLFDLGFGELPEVKGGDDAAHAQWVPVADLTASNMALDHYFIYRSLVSKL